MLRVRSQHNRWSVGQASERFGGDASTGRVCNATSPLGWSQKTAARAPPSTRLWFAAYRRAEDCGHAPQVGAAVRRWKTVERRYAARRMHEQIEVAWALLDWFVGREARSGPKLCGAVAPWFWCATHLAFRNIWA